jgi:hypothetical protein
MEDAPGIPGPELKGPTLFAVTLVGSGSSHQVRMGTEARLMVSGVGLAGAMATVDDLPATVVEASSDTMLVVDVSIPHGAMRGDRSLEVSTPRGNARLDNVLQVTAITASPSGDDAAGQGTDDAPFRTATRSVAASDDGDVIELHDGEYSTGETWPLAIKQGVSLAGTSLSGTILRIGGRDGIQSDGAISDMTISGSGQDTVACVEGNPRLTAVRIESCGVAIVGSASMHDVVIRNVDSAVLVILEEGGALTMDGADIQLTPPMPLSGPPFEVIAAGVFGRGVSILIDRSSIDVSGRVGVGITSVSGSATLTMRRTHIRGLIGISVSGQGDTSLDFGTPMDPGQNTIDADQACVLDPQMPLGETSGLICSTTMPAIIRR